MSDYAINDSRKARYSSKEFLLDNSSLDSYAHACVCSLQIIDDEKPDVILSPMRGAYPPTRVLSSFTPNLSRSPEIITFPASEFIPDKEELFYSALEKVISLYKQNIHILTLDTAITGSSARRFKRMIKQYLPLVYHKQGKDETYGIEYTLIKLWHERDDLRPKGHSHKIRSLEMEFDFNDYNIGVKDLFAEDIPELLGIDYPIHLGKGKKSSFLVRVNTKDPISLVYDDGSRISMYPEGKQNTADLFVKLVTERVEEILEEKLKGSYATPHPPLCEY